MVFEPPPNNSFKPRPLRGSAQMVAFTITPSRAAARLNSGVRAHEDSATVVGCRSNGFWSGAADVLDASDDDVFQAVARRAAARLLGYLMDGYNEGGAVENLSEQEGWPDKDSIGIKIIDHEIPDLDATLFDVEELAV